MLASQKTKITELFKNALAAVGAPENTKIVLERPKQQSHGDIACTVALQCAKAMKQPPRVIAEKLVEQLRKETADSRLPVPDLSISNLLLLLSRMLFEKF